MRLLLGVILGGAIGALVGWKGRCTTGACPLTSNPWLGGIYGALLGALFVTAFSCAPQRQAAKAKGEGGEPNVTAQTESSPVVNLGDAKDFDKLVVQSPVPVVMDLWAPWCGPCRVQGPILEDLARKHGGKVRVVKVNVDQVPELAQRFGVMAIPTLIVFDKGKEKKRLIGVHSLEDVEKAVGF